MESQRTNIIMRKPEWLKTKVPAGKTYLSVREIVEKHKLHTICTSGHCPNMHECWGRGTATLMILGDICTRSCGFCNVKTGRPLPADWQEPDRVAESVKLMKLKHVVLTSVDRDDLKDGGAEIWAMTIKSIKRESPGTTMETLIPDFDGKADLISKLIEAGPEVISHNLETVRRMTPWVRSRAKYDLSLQVLKIIAEAGVITKSGVMLGLGETQEEVLETMRDIRNTGASVMTIGQYLQPTKNHLPVKEFVTPAVFKMYEEEGLKMGFRHVESGPMVRSSYHAEKHIL
ncbi:MAG: lipoyl synthase [Bacteroidetes bacterium]|nr:lipoyl synthase [Bacteroidota bacterium]MBU1579652.1 lipoyl synthase [Bacteroidota bacterium]MBU2557451.1 lipoyl synthase [Bacteroidota bacterium]